MNDSPYEHIAIVAAIRRPAEAADVRSLTPAFISHVSGGNQGLFSAREARIDSASAGMVWFARASGPRPD
jgi:hypothetical protein